MTVAVPASRGFLDRYAAAFGRRQALVLRLVGLTAAEVRGRGAWVEDAGGERWLDFGSFGVHLLGHAHPRVVAAVRAQAAELGLATKVLGNAAAVSAAEALLRTTPAALDRVVFANSGGEAVDLAARLAAAATGRSRFVALVGSYHGRTAAALTLSETVRGVRGLPPAFEVAFVEPHDEGALARELERGDVAAVFAEPVQGEGGIVPVAPERLAAMRAACSASGTLLALDEIQTGLGRCGRVWRSAGACEPDLLAAGKTLGGGMVPVAATAFSSAAIGDLATDPLYLASSFAGGALAARVAQTVVEVVEDDAFLAGVRELGAAARAGLERVRAASSGVVAVRGEGLMLGLALADPGLAGQVVVECARRRLLVSFCLNRPSVVRVYPPAVCEPAELELGVERLADAVAAAELQWDGGE